MVVAQAENKGDGDDFRPAVGVAIGGSSSPIKFEATTHSFTADIFPRAETATVQLTLSEKKDGAQVSRLFLLPVIRTGPMLSKVMLVQNRLRKIGEF